MLGLYMRPSILLTICWAVLAACGDAAEPAAAGQRKLTTQELAQWIDQRFELEGNFPGKPALVDDATFLRRIFVDLQGRIPTVAQARDFLAEGGSFKRSDYVDRLLHDQRQDDHFANRSAEHLARVWRRMLVPATAPGAAIAVRLDPWLAAQFRENTPYDQVAKKLLLTSPLPMQRPGAQPVANNDDPDALAGVFQQVIGASPENLASAYARVFLGVRLACAQCHDHPFTNWKQKDFWGLAAFFSPNTGVGRLPMISPADGKGTYPVKFLWQEEPLLSLTEGQSPKQMLAEWLVAPANPNFAATAVNRIWQYLCGRGLTESVEELDRSTTSEREALDELSRLFVTAGYDLRWLIAGICKSNTYQQVARSEGTQDRIVGRPLKTLLPEQVFDSLEQAIGLPAGKADGGPRYSGERDQFVARMNEAAAETPTDYKAGIPQALMLMNGKLTGDATSLAASRTLRAVVEAPFLQPNEKIEALYLAVLTRRPRPAEMEFLLHRLDAAADDKPDNAGYGEIMWALLNSPEFVLCK